MSPVKIMVIGTGGVGDAMGAVAARRDFVEEIVFSDIDPDRARRTADRLGDRDRFRAIRLDASDRDGIIQALREAGSDAVVNCCDPRFNVPIFDAAFGAGVTYLDMAMTLSSPHPDRPHEEVGVPLGQYQFERSAAWEQRDLLALVGMGVEPGLSDVFARYAADHLFDSIEEVGVRDGSNIEVEGYDFAPTFSIWTTIEECLNPPVVFERDRGWFTAPPLSGKETFVFPEGIGPLECVMVEHEEVLLIPRYLDVGKVTFKYGLGDRFIQVLETLHLLDLDSTEPISVKGTEVAPRDVVAAALPDPMTLGDRMHGLTCAGTWVRGTDGGGAARELYLYHVVDNDQCMATYGSQAVVLQTALNPVIALELIESGTWAGAGVLGPEAFDAQPFLDLLAEYGHPHQIESRDRL
jgi:saccharopine dehydrogenase-like NADP-dependent oxidoreductase